MKVSTVKPEFRPVVITLETQEEVDQMFQLTCTNEFTGVDSEITRGLSDALAKLTSSQMYEQSNDYTWHRKVEE